MRHEDLLVYTMMYYIQEVDLKEKIIQLWNSKEKSGEYLLPEQVVTLMRQWHDVHNLACDRTNPKEHRVLSVLGSGGDSSSCSVCGQPGHQRSDCPLVKSKSPIFCKFHPDLKNSHVTSACRNPSAAPSTSDTSEAPGGLRGSRGRSRGGRSNRGRARGGGRGNRGRSRERSGATGAKEGNISLVNEETENVLSVEAETGEFPVSALARTTSPTDTEYYYSSMDEEEQSQCSKCLEELGSCMLQHSDEEVYSLHIEEICDFPSSGDDDILTPKCEISFISNMTFHPQISFISNL